MLSFQILDINKRRYLKIPQNLFKELEQLEQVEAIVLGGSRAGENYDKDSDYYIFI